MLPAALLLTAGRAVTAQTVVWSGVDAINNINTNWSDANNWSGGVPATQTSVCFYNGGASGTPGVVNNVVGSRATILSLKYGNTNGFHTTQINAGASLTVSNTGAAKLVFAGTDTDSGAGQNLYATVAGAGALVAVDTNASSAFVVQQGSSSSGNHAATLDLSGLASFSLTAGRLQVASFGLGSTGQSNWLSGTLYLAQTNLIRLNGGAPAMDVGDAGANPGNPSCLFLGQTNAIFADTLTVAHSKTTATLAFNPALAGSNPVLQLGGNTNAQMTTLAIGDDSAQSTSSYSFPGMMDLSGGRVYAAVNTCYVGLGQAGNGAGSATGTLKLGAGVFNVNTLFAGYVNSSAATANVYGTVTVTNGTLVVNNSLVLGYNPGATATAFGTLNIVQGTVLANRILAGGTSIITINGGLLVVSNGVGLLAATLSSLTVSGGATLQFQAANNQTNVVVGTLAGDNSGVINIGALPVVLAYPSAYPLVYASAGTASPQFSLGTLPGGYLGYLSNAHAHLIELVITNGPTLPKTDVWAGGVNNNWDTNTLNWTNGGVAAVYREGDLVVFNDAAPTGLVNLAGKAPHTPYSWSVTNNGLNYVFAGTNSVGGTAGLIKSGAGSLTLAESNDTFSGGITVNGGILILDAAANAISGGLSIASGATVQVGNNDGQGGLPAGVIANNGTLVFNQNTVSMVSAAVGGSGALTQNGSGVLVLGGSNSYTGNTMVLRGTLALTNGGAIASSASVTVSQGTLEVAGAAGGTTLGNLNLTNGVLTVGATPVAVAGLSLGGTSNTINVAALPGFLFYPTNVTLVQSSQGMLGNNLSLGNLPAGTPPYTGSVVASGTAVVLALTAGPLAVVRATIAFSPTNAGLVLNPAFDGLSYEKSMLTGSLFATNDTSLAAMFGQITPAILRVGGNSVDTTCWGGVSNLTPITASEVDAFAGFVKALPAGWQVLYGINMSVNSTTNCVAEAAYVAKALGPRLLGFEIGNEPDLYYNNGIRSAGYTFTDYLAQWRALAAAITNAVPGWAITNGGSGWTLTGPVSAYNTSAYSVPFAGDEVGVVSLLSQHYYRANGQLPSSTIALLLQPDTGLPGTVSSLAAAAVAAKLPLGFRMAECGSFYNGGAPNVSDAYGTALWALDFMFTCALNGCQGINFHGGGNGTGYTPIADNGKQVVQARPEFYGLKMFSLAGQGRVIPAMVTLASNINFTAYGVRRAGGGISALLNNKDTNHGVQVTLNLGPGVTAAQAIELTGTNLNGTNGYTLGGATINPDGSWAGGVQFISTATNGQITYLVPPITAVWLNPVVTGTNLGFSVTGNQLTLSWPTNYLGWLLQSNSAGPGDGNEWFTVPGSTVTNRVKMTLWPNQSHVFYRMASP